MSLWQFNDCEYRVARRRHKADRLPQSATWRKPVGAGHRQSSAQMLSDDSVRGAPSSSSRGPSAHGLRSVGKAGTQFYHEFRPRSSGRPMAGPGAGVAGFLNVSHWSWLGSTQDCSVQRTRLSVARSLPLKIPWPGQARGVTGPAGRGPVQEPPHAGGMSCEEGNFTVAQSFRFCRHRTTLGTPPPGGLDPGLAA